MIAVYLRRWSFIHSKSAMDAFNLMGTLTFFNGPLTYLMIGLGCPHSNNLARENFTCEKIDVVIGGIYNKLPRRRSGVYTYKGCILDDLR